MYLFPLNCNRRVYKNLIKLAQPENERSDSMNARISTLVRHVAVGDISKNLGEYFTTIQYLEYLI